MRGSVTRRLAERVGVALRASSGQIGHSVIKFSRVLDKFARVHVMRGDLRQRLLAAQSFQRHPRLDGHGVVASRHFHRYNSFPYRNVPQSIHLSRTLTGRAASGNSEPLNEEPGT